MTRPLESDEVRRGVNKLHPASERTRKEGQYLLELDGVIVGRVTIPKGRKFLPWRTFESVCAQAALTKQQMYEVASCKKGRAEAEVWWREKLSLPKP